MNRAQRLGHTAPSTARVITEIAVTSAVVGVLMGVLWWMLAPEVVGVVVNGGLAADSQEGQKLFERDAVFALLAAGCGFVLAVTFAARHRRSPVTALVTLVVCGVGGSWIAQLIGGLLGPGSDIGGLSDGAEQVFPLQLESRAGLIVWSMVATVVVGVIAVFREDQAAWSVPGAPPSE